MKNRILVLLITISYTHGLSADNISTILENLINSLGNNSNVITAENEYFNSLVEQKYSHLQWWQPSLQISNDIIYPYKNDYYDNLATANTTTLIFQAPVFTGTVLNLSVSYGINRDVLDNAMLTPVEWGFSQDFQYKIGIGQSLNPWWLHYRKNPYRIISNIKTNLSENSIMQQIKTALISCIQDYISLRKSERNMELLSRKISLYNDMLETYLKMQPDGLVTWRDIHDIRENKWEYEQNYFTLEYEMANKREALYNLTGLRVDTVAQEELIKIDFSNFGKTFPALNLIDLSRSEEMNLHLQKEILDIEKLINNQTNAPLIRLEFGTQYKLSVQTKDDIGEAWRKKNFDDNILNNWSFTVNMDISNYIMSLNKKNELEYKNSMDMFSKLLKKTRETIKHHEIQIENFINILEGQIKQLDDIIQRESKIIVDIKTMLERGAITELDYRQTIIEYEQKCILLRNLNDELWMYKFISMFY
jgi:hypothetical protein